MSHQWICSRELLLRTVWYTQDSIYWMEQNKKQNNECFKFEHCLLFYCYVSELLATIPSFHFMFPLRMVGMANGLVNNGLVNGLVNPVLILSVLNF